MSRVAEEKKEPRFCENEHLDEKERFGQDGGHFGSRPVGAHGAGLLYGSLSPYLYAVQKETWINMRGPKSLTDLRRAYSWQRE